MKRQLALLCVIILTLGVVGVSAAPLADGAPSNTSNTSCWTDSFAGLVLNSRWSWIREDTTHWSLITNPGFLRITTQDGTFLANYGSDQKNILVTDAPSDNYQITTKVKINPTKDYQSAGILVYVDDDNYLHLMEVYDGGDIYMSFHNEIGGVVTMNSETDSAPTVYLRIERQNSTYKGYYSKDGINWNLVYTYNRSLNNPKIGLTASNSLDGVTQIPADFDFFQLGGCPLSGNFLFLPLVVR
jgi:beta-xylosidase